jgi:seryl-tRNA synthetase
MLGLDFVKANRETVEKAIRDKGVDLDLDALLALDAEVRAAKTEIDKLRAERNAVSAKFKDASPEEKAELGRQAKEAGARASAIESELEGKDAELKALMLKLPGIPYEGAPVGPDESFNTVIRTEGEPPKFDFEPLDHVALIEKNGWGDLSRVTQVSGSRTYCLKGALALLEAKLMAWALEKIAGGGFTPITVPAIAR